MRAPLADRMRPATLADFVGQEELLGEGKFLSSVLSARPLPSSFSGVRPESGKTTLARILAAETKAVFLPYSAVLSGIKEIREALAELKRTRSLEGPGNPPAILFIDEIHRFNKAQQDALLPFVEDGTVTLFGTTTENPSFEIRNALLSRCVCWSFRPPSLPSGADRRRALTDSVRGWGNRNRSSPSTRCSMSSRVADGDARVALNALEAAVAIAEHKGFPRSTWGRRRRLCGKKGSSTTRTGRSITTYLRPPQEPAGVGPGRRPLLAGADARRGGGPALRRPADDRFASEDVGNAAPGALQMTVAAAETYERLGSPEGELALAQAAVYLATAPKSNPGLHRLAEGHEGRRRPAEANRCRSTCGTPPPG